MNGGRFLLLVTGASRGFGRCVAEEFVRQVAPTSPVDLVLVARSESGLLDATDAIDEMARGIHTPDGVADVVVRREALDLGDLDKLEAGLEGVLSRIGELCFADSWTIPSASIKLAREMAFLRRKPAAAYM